MGTPTKCINREKETIRKMLSIYCQAKHLEKANKLCSDCEQLFSYALNRIDHCVYGSEKPTCQNCVIHCYSRINSEKIKVVMRYSGPRMIYKFPILAINHFINKFLDKSKIPIIEGTRIKKPKNDYNN